MTKKIGILFQARSGSTRLPSKILLPFFEQQNILELILQKFLKNGFDTYPIIVATTTSYKDDEVVQVAQRNGVNVFRGSESDVLQRFIEAGRSHGITDVIRVCSDNPFLQINEYLQQLIDRYLMTNPDYLSYQLFDGTPVIKSHLGLFCEMVSMKALEKVAELTDENLYHEHVTNFIYGHPEIFSVEWLPAPNEVVTRNDIRLTLDTPEDFEHLQQLYKLVGAKNLKEIIQFIDESPEMKEYMNEQIMQNSK